MRGFERVLETANQYSRACLELPTGGGGIIPPGGGGIDTNNVCRMARPNPGNMGTSCLLQDPDDWEALFDAGRIYYWPASVHMPGGQYTFMNAMTFWDYKVTDQAEVVWDQSPPLTSGGYLDREGWPPLEGRRCQDEPDSGEVPCDAWYMVHSLNGYRRADGTMECSNCNYCGARYPNSPRSTCEENMYHTSAGCGMDSPGGFDGAKNNVALLMVTTNIDSFCV